MKKCSDVMTRNVITAETGDSVASVAQLMKNNDIGPIPIVDNRQSKMLVGIITDRDLAIKVVAEGRDPKSTPVMQVMTTDVITCRPDDNIETALDAMATQQLRRIPVVDDSNMLVGIISQADIATRMNKPEKTGEVVKEISE
jgi:CBS domain-containing protein